jgi:phosphoribosylanthranilate isomerase
MAVLKPIRKPRVKICCMQSAAEAKMAIRMGASALGLVSWMPSGPGPISDEEIGEIVKTIPPPIASFLLTCETDAAAIIEQQRRLRTNTLQLVDRLERGTYEEIRKALPGIAIVQVIHVRGEESIAEALRAADRVDALLLDSGNPDLEIKELGGTGRVHNWAISRKIVEAVSRPVFLAGGLRPDNVKRAIKTVGPFGLDVCSGVRSGGKLDPKKLAAFFKAVNGYS